MSLMWSDHDRLLHTVIPRSLCLFTARTGLPLIKYGEGEEDFEREKRRAAHLELFKDNFHLEHKVARELRSC